MSDGLTDRQHEIADRLGLVRGTVANAVVVIMRKLGLRNRAQLAVRAVKQGLYWGRRGGRGAGVAALTLRWPSP